MNIGVIGKILLIKVLNRVFFVYGIFRIWIESLKGLIFLELRYMFSFFDVGMRRRDLRVFLF